MKIRTMLLLVGTAWALALMGVGHSDQESVVAETAVTTALCAVHNAPAAKCFICDASVREKGRLWCREHNRYEDRCFECHPELRQADRLYCEEHGLYEDECFYCHPELLRQAADHSAATPIRPHMSQELYCHEHDVPEAQCGICQPTLADELLPGQGLKIRLPSAASATKAGIVSTPPRQGPSRSRVEAVGELGFNQNRLVHITPFSEGIIRKIYVDLGQEVRQGEVLAEITSPTIAAAKASLLKAVAEKEVAAKGLAREQALFAQKVSAAQDLFDAEARHEITHAQLQAAEQILVGLGFGQEEIDRIITQREGGSTFQLKAPFDGTVTARHAVVGDVVAVGDPLFSVTDLHTLWLNLAVAETEVAKLHPGQRIEVQSPAFQRAVSGRLTWISSQIDKTTRMVQVRAEVENGDRTLRAGLFVNAHILQGDNAPSFFVARDAVHRFGGQPFVFVRLEADLYELRRVETGPQVDEYLAIVAGLNDRDQVASVQSYLVKSEFQKSRLGAGCVD